MLDAVITYVDSRDENWKREYNMFVKRPLEEVENRFRSYDCLDLQIKLIRKNMKFVDIVYVIVSSPSQVPDNVKNMDKVKIVTHKEIIPKRYLPCFNSCTIEMYMYNIKDLKENFIYFNDDMFVVSKCEETDFIKNGKFIIDYEYKDFDPEFATPFEMNVINANRLVDKSATTFIKPAHFCMPLNKNHITEVWVMHKNEIEKSMTRTRHRNNINFYAFIDYEIVNKNAVWKEMPSKYFTTLDNLELQYQDIIEKKAKLICVNDSGMYDDSFIGEFRLMLECLLTKRKFVESKQELEIKKLIGDSKIVVTMTSWKNRIFLVNNVIKNMLSQTLEPNKIVLNLSINEFPNQELSLPKDLVQTIHENSNICEIYWVKENYKQFKKLVHTLDRYPNDIIISIDDDFPYPSNFVETLYNDYIDNKRQNPISYSDYVDSDGNYTHHGSFTITESKFYGEYLHKILDEFVYPNFRKYKCYDDPVYTEAAKLNGYEYKEGSVNYNKFRLTLHSETPDALSKRTVDYSEKRNEFMNNLKEFCETIKPKIEPNQLIEHNQLKVALCAIAKNENLYIREWVEWYKNLGISKIFLYDNNEIFNGERFEEVINDYIESGFVEIVNRRGITISVHSDKDGQTLQGLSFKDCFYNNYKNYDYICFFDIDEYLEIYDYSVYKNLNEFLQDFDKYDGIRVQWKMYGDNNQLYYENKPVFERFKSESNASYDKHVKQILNCNKVFDEELSFCAHGVFNKKYIFVNVNKKPLKNVYMDITGYNDLPVYLNHFYSKSTEEFLKRKYNKPSAVSGTNNTRNFNIDFLKKQYFEYNKVTNEKEQMFNKLSLLSEAKNYDHIIVAFTSYKERINYCNLVIDSLLNGSIKPYKIVLTLYKDDLTYVTPELKKQIKENLVELIIADKDLKSHKKYFYVMQKYREYPIITCDDDCILQYDFVESLVNNYKKFPYCVSARRVHKKTYEDNGNVKVYKKWIRHYDKELLPSYDLVAIGVGGILYPPNILNISENNLEDIYKYISVDDIYLHYLELKNNVPIAWVPNKKNHPDIIPGSQETSLFKDINKANESDENSPNNVAIRNLLNNI